MFDRLDKKAADFRAAPATPLPSGMATPASIAPALGDADDLDAGDADLGEDDEEVDE